MFLFLNHKSLQANELFDIPSAAVWFVRTGRRASDGAVERNADVLWSFGESEAPNKRPVDLVLQIQSLRRPFTRPVSSCVSVLSIGEYLL